MERRGLGRGSVHYPGVNQTLTHQIILNIVQIKTILVSCDTTTLVLNKVRLIFQIIIII